MSLREQNLSRLDQGVFDVLIVGGGINGAVSAATLASRGVSVAMIDRADFGGFTSQESSNLVWGGFKYLQNYEIPLVWKLCRSRNQLMKAYPTSIAEVSFLGTLDESAPFPSWLAGLGTVAYWALGGFATKSPRYHTPARVEKLEPVVDTTSADAGVEYRDGYLKDNDSRFVWDFVRLAIDHGACATNYTSLESADLVDGRWQAKVRDVITGHEMQLSASAMINAAGPFVDRLNDTWGVTTDHRIVYSKGIHLVVPRLTESERVLAFFDDSQRLFYVIPMAHRSVIGTTDTRTSDPREGVTDDDRHFLLKQINARLDLDQPLTVDDIISERCGVRPLVVDNDDDQSGSDWTALSRKHRVETDKSRRTVTIFGGKLTDCLNVGEEVAEAIEKLGVALGRESDDWYGEPSAAERARFIEAAHRVGLDRAPEVEREPSMASLMWRRHGLAAHRILRAITLDPAQGEVVLPETDLIRAELPLYADREMIVELDDFLRRRTKLAMIHRDDELAASPAMAEIREALGLT